MVAFCQLIYSWARIGSTLGGRALYLRNSVHTADAQAMDGHVEGLRDTACEMRRITNTIEA
ncbi:hypothetical protein P5705_05440 [Pseudomonas entomophila]|uniref:hypothetical protein n=1 Tax=Pseudomonas entomophila TaxID=312306 RepID=UPI0024065DE9|nr:hypothetical protein [Pseudomonas entomophila]MDF9617075.1 hypothetical protein [Pseudomonas entomophila]